jgi:hypothetical protein
MAGEADYVLGLEPCNAPVVSRADLRARGLLPSIAPGETRGFRVEMGVAAGAAAAAALEAQIGVAIRRTPAP